MTNADGLQRAEVEVDRLSLRGVIWRESEPLYLFQHVLDYEEETDGS